MKNYFLALITVCSFTFTQAQTVVGDATLPNTITMGGTDLVLNGAGDQYIKRVIIGTGDKTQRNVK